MIKRLNNKEGKEILDKSGLKILSANDLNDAAKQIVEARFPGARVILAEVF